LILLLVPSNGPVEMGWSYCLASLGTGKSGRLG
jgi:hypothetical protein